MIGLFSALSKPLKREIFHKKINFQIKMEYFLMKNHIKIISLIIISCPEMPNLKRKNKNGDLLNANWKK